MSLAFRLGSVAFTMGLMALALYIPVSYTHLDVYKRQDCGDGGQPLPD